MLANPTAVRADDRRAYNCTMPTFAKPEQQSFHIFWEQLTGKNLSEEELKAMQNPSDPPDFQFRHEGKLVGMEHTEVFRRVSPFASAKVLSLEPKHDYAIQDRIVAHMEKFVKLAPDQMPRVDILITFASCRQVVKADEPSIAGHALDLIWKRLRDGTPLPLELYMHDLSEIHPCLGQLLVAEGGTSSSVSRHAFGMVDEWGLPDFEIAARKKADDLPRYKTRFDRCWLLLSAGGTHPAQWIEPSDKACSTGIKTAFDRVFFVDVSRRKVYEIGHSEQAASAAHTIRAT
jgi:hypothetical protein